MRHSRTTKEKSSPIPLEIVQQEVGRTDLVKVAGRAVHRVAVAKRHRNTTAFTVAARSELPGN